MSKPTLVKITIAILFALAIALGLIQNAQNPFTGRKTVFREIQKLPASGDSLADYYKKARELAPQTPPETTATFFAAGDIMLSRNVAGTMEKSGDLLLPFSKMADVLKSTDFNFANLESPITTKKYFNPSGSMVFNAPTAYTQGLEVYNFKILNLANNHAMDQSEDGLAFTMNYLDQKGIKHVGAAICGYKIWECYPDTWAPAIIDANGIKIGFIGASYASINDSGKTKTPFVARIEDIENLKSAISTLKTQADFVVVTMHAGTEYKRNPNDAQTKFAHAAIDAGADIVIGAHPHWVQTIERYAPNCPSPIHGEGAPSASEGRERLKCDNPKYIFYSLGNFIFDQEWSQDTKEGLTLKITLTKPQSKNPLAPDAATLEDLQGPRVPASLKQIELLPVIIENYSTPRLADEKETKKILDKIGETNTILK